MMLTRRILFPTVYLVFLLPLITSSTALRAVVLIACPVIALAIGFRRVKAMFILLATAFGTLIPLLLLVQADVCSSAAFGAASGFLSCIAERSVAVILNVCLLSSLSLLAVANEWRGSLPPTINRMGLPRSIRVMTIVSGAMIGGFRRSMYKVHHAFTSRGDALPSFNWKNAAALPTMLGVAWASELNGAVNKIKGQWASDSFWERYVPDRIAKAETKYTISDLIVLIVATALIVAFALQVRGGGKFSL
jgi:hypothetical protein